MSRIGGNHGDDHYFIQSGQKEQGGFNAHSIQRSEGSDDGLFEGTLNKETQWSDSGIEFDSSIQNENSPESVEQSDTSSSKTVDVSTFSDALTRAASALGISPSDVSFTYSDDESAFTIVSNGVEVVLINLTEDNLDESINNVLSFTGSAAYSTSPSGAYDSFNEQLAERAAAQGISVEGLHIQTDYKTLTITYNGQTLELCPVTSENMEKTLDSAISFLSRAAVSEAGGMLQSVSDETLYIQDNTSADDTSAAAESKNENSSTSFKDVVKNGIKNIFNFFDKMFGRLFSKSDDDDE